ncbi:hypothetical protein AN958_01822 [Leucoagaricus sp. SymC.cos]|nr:hypothetical protein AN958_01822 [Leucoagaricus sp. SymC.cos]
MDRLESLGNQISSMTFYDIKTMYNQAKNMVLNISETEAKVREATNDDPWGASSTLMQEIAQGTFNFQQFNEIMPCIYSRFMEKEASQWRQIYKALQLLEYLVKHGSERVVDDARSHIGTLKMLRSFHYIDEKGKDEGINVRNRAKELVELLSDVEKIRTERRRAKANKNKYIGVGNDGGYGSFSSGGGRYGGFGSDSLGGGSSYGNDYYSGGGSSSRMGGFSDSSSRRNQYEEYNAGDDEIPSGSASVSSPTRAGSARSPPSRQSSTAATTTPAPAPVKNLLDFDDDVAPIPATQLPAGQTGMATNKALPKPVGLDDDDFDDFQAAPVQAQAPAPTQVRAPTSPTTTGQQQQGARPNLFQLMNATPLSPTSPTQVSQQPPQQFGGLGGLGIQQQHRASPSIGGGGAPMFGGGATMRPTPTAPSIPMGGGTSPMLPTPMRANTASPVNQQQQGQQKNKAAGGGGFDDLWNLSLASSGKAKSAGSNDGVNSCTLDTRTNSPLVQYTHDPHLPAKIPSQRREPFASLNNVGHMPSAPASTHTDKVAPSSTSAIPAQAPLSAPADSQQQQQEHTDKGKGRPIITPASLATSSRRQAATTRSFSSLPPPQIATSLIQSEPSLLAPPILSVTGPTPEVSPITPSTSLGKRAHHKSEPETPSSVLRNPGLEVPQVQKSWSSGSGKRKAEEAAESEGNTTPPKEQKEHRATFAPEPRAHRASASSHAPSSFRRKRARLSLPSDSSNPPSRPSSRTAMSSVQESPNAKNTGSWSSKKSGRGSILTDTASNVRRAASASTQTHARNDSCLSQASIPLSALISPHAPSITHSGTFHMRDPRKPGPIQSTSWSLSFPSRVDDGESWWDRRSWVERGGSPLCAWLFFFGFVIFPVWWVTWVIGVPKTRRLGDSEAGGREKSVILDDPQVEYDARSWRKRCRIMSGVSLVTYIPFIILVIVFAR